MTVEGEGNPDVTFEKARSWVEENIVKETKRVVTELRG